MLEQSSSASGRPTRCRSSSRGTFASAPVQGCSRRARTARRRRGRVPPARGRRRVRTVASRRSRRSWPATAATSVRSPRCERLRTTWCPRSFAGLDATVLVTGETAEVIDYRTLTDRWLPIVFVFVLGLSFVLLTVAFRSIVLPAVAIGLNLLSVGAAYGLLVLVFLHGVGRDLLGFTEVDVIAAWVPLFLFAVLFGLSMDYTVFLLSRIRERVADGERTTEAVVHGVSSTARIITGAALIIIAVFVGFAAGDQVEFQQMGFGVAVSLADRRDARAPRAAPGGAHAARRAELVPAALARLDAAPRDRGVRPLRPHPLAEVGDHLAAPRARPSRRRRSGSPGSRSRCARRRSGSCPPASLRPRRTPCTGRPSSTSTSPASTGSRARSRPSREPVPLPGDPGQHRLDLRQELLAARSVGVPVPKLAPTVPAGVVDEDPGPLRAGRGSPPRCSGSRCRRRSRRC